MLRAFLDRPKYSLLLLAFISPLSIGVNLQAAEETSNSTYHIEKMSRRDALVELAKKAGYEILFSYNASPKDSVEAFDSPLPLEDSLIKLLEGTDLRFTINNKQIRITRLGQEYSRMPPVTVLGYLRSSNKNVSFEDDSQERFPLYQVPLSVQSVSKEFIEETQARELEDVLSYIGGIEYLNRNGGINPSYYSRGIATPSSIDGKFYRRTFINQDPAILERIDLIQGPSANFLMPGGMLNFVTKKPEEKPFAEFSVTGGSWDFYRTELDINLNSKSETQSGFRLVGVLENKGHFKQHTEMDKYILAPSATIEFDNGSQLLANGIYSYRNETANTTTIHEDFLPRKLPIDRLLSLPWSIAETKETHAAIDYRNLELGEWRFNAGANWYRTESDNSPVAFSPLAPGDFGYTREGDGGLVRFNADDQELETYGFDTAIERSIDVFSIPTLLRVGIDHQNWNIFTPFFTNIFGTNFDFLGFFNIYEPNYNIPEPAKATSSGNSKQNTDFWGLFVSQNYYISDLLTAHLDLRYEDMKTDIKTRDTQPFERNWKYTVTYRELTPQFGINFNLSDTFSSHISYSESFSSQTTPDAATFDNLVSIDGKYVDPVENRQLEVAFKSKLFDGRLASNLTLYKLKVSNIQYFWTDADPEVNAPADSVSFFNGRADDQYSQGLTFNINGAITNSLDIILNYAYNETETAAVDPEINLEPDPQPNNYYGVPIGEPIFVKGKAVAGTAKSVANAWLSYDSKTGALENYEFGLGLKYVGDRYGDFANSYTLPAYRTVEFVTRYSGFDGVEVAFIIRNLLDEYYYKGALELPTLVEEGDPRSFYLTFKSSHNF